MTIRKRRKRKSRELASREIPGSFRWLLRASWIPTLVWMATVLFASQDWQLWALTYSQFAFWPTLLAYGVVTTYVFMRMHRVSLGLFIVLVVVWGNTSGLVFAVVGWEAGVTVLLSLLVLIPRSVMFSECRAELLGVRTVKVRFGMAVLGFAWKFACLIVLVLVALPFVGLDLEDPSVRWFYWPAALVSVPVFAALFFVDHRADRAARVALDQLLACEENAPVLVARLSLLECEETAPVLLAQLADPQNSQVPS